MAETDQNTSFRDEVRIICRRIIANGATGAFAGSIGGSTIGTMRGKGPSAYAGSMAVTIGYMTFTCSAFNEGLKYTRGGISDPLNYAAAGAISGGMLTTMYGGPSKGAAAAVAMSVVGFTAFFAEKKVNQWLEAIGKRRFEARYGIKVSADSNNTQANSTTTDERGFMEEVFGLKAPSWLKLETSDEEIERRVQERLKVIDEQQKRK